MSRQTEETEGKTCTYTNPGINLKDEALTPSDPSVPLDLPWKLVDVLELMRGR